MRARLRGVGWLHGAEGRKEAVRAVGGWSDLAPHVGFEGALRGLEDKEVFDAAHDTGSPSATSGHLFNDRSEPYGVRITQSLTWAYRFSVESLVKA